MRIESARPSKRTVVIAGLNPAIHSVSASPAQMVQHHGMDPMVKPWDDADSKKLITRPAKDVAVFQNLQLCLHSAAFKSPAALRSSTVWRTAVGPVLGPQEERVP